MNNEDVMPCAYCGNLPTLVQPKQTGSIFDKTGKYVCLANGCPGQRNQSFQFGYLRIWNKRQVDYGRNIKKAKQVIPALWSAA